MSDFEICKKCHRKYIPRNNLPFLIAIISKPKKRIIAKYGNEKQITTANSNGEALIELMNFPTNPYRFKRINCHRKEITGFRYKEIIIDKKRIKLTNNDLAKCFMKVLEVDGKKANEKRML